MTRFKHFAYFFSALSAYSLLLVVSSAFAGRVMDAESQLMSAREAYFSGLVQNPNMTSAQSDALAQKTIVPAQQNVVNQMSGAVSDYYQQNGIIQVKNNQEAELKSQEQLKNATPTPIPSSAQTFADVLKIQKPGKKEKTRSVAAQGASDLETAPVVAPTTHADEPGIDGSNVPKEMRFPGRPKAIPSGIPSQVPKK